MMIGKKLDKMSPKEAQEVLKDMINRRYSYYPKSNVSILSVATYFAVAGIAGWNIEWQLLVFAGCIIIERIDSAIRTHYSLKKEYQIQAIMELDMAKSDEDDSKNN